MIENNPQEGKKAIKFFGFYFESCHISELKVYSLH